MNMADRIQGLRKAKGISQEQLADQLGVSRQAVSKWEAEQSAPEIDKIILLSDYFGVTTDYLLKGTETKPEGRNEETVFHGVVIRLLAAVGSAVNLIGLIIAVTIWIEEQSPVSVAVGLMLMVIGCLIYVIGRFIGEKRKKVSIIFWLVNIWFLSLIPISCVFNFIQGTLGRFWWTFTPVPQMGNSIVAYGICWLVYLALCIGTDIAGIFYLRSRKMFISGGRWRNTQNEWTEHDAAAHGGGVQGRTGGACGK